MSVVSRFKTLITRIAPSSSELTKARSYIGSIRSRLYKDFAVKKFVKIGSHSRQTAIRSYSDVDYIVVLSRDEVKWGSGWVASSTILNRIRNSLLTRYWSTTVRRDQQAVVIDFGRGQNSVDIVPAFYYKAGPHNYPIYAIPNGVGEWTATAPELHSKYLRKEDIRSRFQLRRTVQLIKFWRFCRIPNIPLLSFHLEMLISAEGVCIGAKSYAECLYRTFQLLSSRECRALRDPLGISGNIPGVATSNQQEYACKAVAYAYDRSYRALYAEQQKDIKEAYKQWDIVFNGQFP